MEPRATQWLFATAVVAALFFWGPKAKAELIYDACASYTSAGYYLTGKERLQAVYNYNASPTALATEVWLYHEFKYPNNSLFVGECLTRDKSTYSKDPNAPPKGDSENSTPSGGWTNWIIEGGCVAATLVSCGSLNITCAVVGGFCAGVVRELQEHSPDWLAQTSNLNDNTQSVFIPFVVTNKGDGDWLSLQLNGEEFWRHSLAEFDVNTPYFAAVPDALISARDSSTWFFYLGSVGDANARVLFSSFAPTAVPVPAAAWLLASGLLLLGALRQRARHVSVF